MAREVRQPAAPRVHCNSLVSCTNPTDEPHLPTDDRYANRPPLEWRSLYKPSSQMPTGTLEMWCEILTPQQAKAKKPDDIKPPADQEWEMRVVVWQLKGVPPEAKGMDFGGMGDFYVRCRFEDQLFNTDTHLRAKNGKASWNWRMLFPVKLGHTNQFKRLTVQLWEYDLFGSDDIIGETSLVLDDWFTKQFKKRKPEPVYWDRERDENLWLLGKEPSPTGVFARMGVVKEKIKEVVESLTSGSPPLNAGDPGLDGARFWAPLKCRNEKGEYLTDKNGKEKAARILLSIQLVPQSQVAVLPASAGDHSGEHNKNPELPKPVGRLTFSLNPFTMFAQLFGDQVAGDCLRMCCCLICIVLSVVLGFFMFPAVLGNVVTEVFTG